MKKVEVGGQRLRDGKKITVNMHDYQRSNHDLSHVVRTSMNIGTLVPIFKQIGLPGDTIDLSTTTMIRTVPTQAALFGSFKFQIDFFVCPMRLYIGALHNNTLEVGNNMDKVVLPTIKLTAAPQTKFSNYALFDVNTQQIAPDSLNRYLGIAGVGNNPNNNTAIREFMGMYHLGYYDIAKNYYINKQEPYAYVVGIGKENTANITWSSTLLDGIIAVPEEQPISIQPSGKTFTFNMDGEFTGQEETSIIVYFGNSLTGQVTFKLNEKRTFGVNGVEFTGTFTANQTTLKGILKIQPTTGATQQITFYQDFIEATILGDTTNSTFLRLNRFPIKNLDKCRSQILKLSEIGEYVTITGSGNTSENAISYLPYSINAEYDENAKKMYCKESQTGLLVKTHLSDMYNNWVKTDWIEQVNQRSAVQVNNGSFTIDALIINKRVFNYLNRVALSGGTTQDWQEATWGVDAQSFCESPIFVGGMSGDIIFDEVVSTAASGEQALGTLAGRGNIDNVKGGNINIKIKEPSIILGIMSITPRVDYSQGNEWDTFQIKTMEDLHKPEFDGIGFQDMPTEWLAWWDTIVKRTGTITQVQRFSLGKQPAWIQYMSNVNKVYGDFARQNNLQSMVITRNYQPSIEGEGVDPNQSIIADATTYIRPDNYNYLFASKLLSFQPFWVQIGIKELARRKMSAAIMPML